MTAATMTPVPTADVAPGPRRGKRGWVFHAVMGPIAVLWVLPLVFVILVAAGALIAAVPTTSVFFAVQKQFVSGRLVGANK